VLALIFWSLGQHGPYPRVIAIFWYWHPDSLASCGCACPPMIRIFLGWSHTENLLASLSLGGLVSRPSAAQLFVLVQRNGNRAGRFVDWAILHPRCYVRARHLDRHRGKGRDTDLPEFQQLSTGGDPGFLTAISLVGALTLMLNSATALRPPKGWSTGAISGTTGQFMAFALVVVIVTFGSATVFGEAPTRSRSSPGYRTRWCWL